MTVKPYLSKTIWLNVILGVLAAITPLVAPASGISVWVQAHSAQIALLWSVAGVAIRLITKGKISLED